jgi:hypothetical protein
MDKLELRLEELAVESFVAGEEHRPDAGTVLAHSQTAGAQWTCNHQHSCDCPITVDATCMSPCGTTLCVTVPPDCAEG